MCLLTFRTDPDWTCLVPGDQNLVLCFIIARAGARPACLDTLCSHLSKHPQRIPCTKKILKKIGLLETATFFMGNGNLEGLKVLN